MFMAGGRAKPAIRMLILDRQIQNPEFSNKEKRDPLSNVRDLDSCVRKATIMLCLSL